MLVALALSALSLASLVYAGRVALSIADDRRAHKSRIRRATRPRHGRAIIYAAPARAINRPGEN